MNLIRVDEVWRRMRIVVWVEMIAGGRMIVRIGVIVVQADALLVGTHRRAHTLIAGILVVSD